MITSKTIIKSSSNASLKRSRIGAHFQKAMVFRGLVWLFTVGLLSSNFVYAQSFSYEGDAGDLGDGCHQLTPNASNIRGAMWETFALDFSRDFEIEFSANFGAINGGGDGMAVVFQNSGTSALGGNGPAMGFAANGSFSAITQSLAIEFDTHDDGAIRGDGGSGNDHIAIVVDGNQASPLQPIVDAKFGGLNIEDNVFHEIKVEWDASTNTLKVYFDGGFRTSITQNFVSTVFSGNPYVFWGVTASTGATTNQQRICNPPVCAGSPEFQTSIGHLDSGVPDDGEEAFSVKPANDCGYIAAGQTSPSSVFGTLMIAKTDANGNDDWVNTYSVSSGGLVIRDGRFTNIESLGDGYIATGWMLSNPTALLIVRLENNGSVRWATVLDGTQIWDNYDIEPTPDDGFIVVGSAQNRVLLVHLDENGVQNWSRTYGVENEVWRGYSVEPVANDFDGVRDDGYVICGSRSTIWDLTRDWLIIETDNQGTLISAETQGTWGEDDEALCVKQVDMDGDGILDPGEYAVGGYVSYAIGFNPPREIGAFIHYRATGLNGNPRPAVIMDDTYNESRITALEQDRNGDIVCTGSLNESGSSLRDGFFVKSSLDGLYSWAKVYGTNGSDDWFNSIEETKDFGYVMAGGTESFGTGDGDFYVVKIDEWGNSPCNTLQRAYGAAPAQMYMYTHSPTTTDFGALSPVTAVAVSEMPDVDNCMVINKKASHTTSMDNPEESTMAIYPNPVANGSILHIGIEEGLTGNALVVLTDITGKTQLVKQYSLTQGSSELSLPINQLSPGMYHVSVRTDQGTSVYKVLIE